MQAEAQPETIARAARQLGCRSVAFTYNDPVIFHEYARDVSIACREAGVRTVAVTAGYLTDRARADFFRHVDAANVDLKAFTERFYRDVTKSRLQPVLDTLVYLARETSVWLEITNLIIPGENDGEAEIDAMTAWVVENLGPEVPMHFSAFHPDYRMLDTGRTPFETLARARRIARRNGVRHAYTGNVHDAGRQSSYCHACGNRVITRNWYELGDWNLTDDGRCTGCGTVMAGVFDGRPGSWGRKRRPVDVTGFREG